MDKPAPDESPDPTTLIRSGPFLGETRKISPTSQRKRSDAAAGDF
jgi:hypothetical protein